MDGTASLYLQHDLHVSKIVLDRRMGFEATIQEWHFVIFLFDYAHTMYFNWPPFSRECHFLWGLVLSVFV